MVEQRKTALVTEIEEKLKKAKGVILTNFQGLNVHEFEDLRRNFGKEVEYKIFKNTLIRIAATKCNLGDLEKFLKGPTALTLCYDDPLPVSKKISEFAKEYKALKIKGGVLEDKVVDGDYIKKLAELPSREALIATVIGGVKSPLARLVGALRDPVAKLIGVLDQVAAERAGT